MRELLESEARKTLLSASYERFDMDYDPRCEFGIEEALRLRRWLHVSLPDALQQLREPPPDRSRQERFRRELGIDTRNYDEVLFPQGRGR